MKSNTDTINITKKIEAYYRGERISNAVVFLIGGAAITWTLLLYLWRQGHLSSGFFIATLPLGLFFIGTGALRFFRSFKMYKMAIEQVNDKEFYSLEIDYLEARVVRFNQKRNVNMIGIAIGFFSSIVAVLAQMSHILVGTCLSVTIFSALLLVFDLFGQFRVEEYLHFLKKAQ